MSAIAILCAETGHDSTTRTKAALQGLGHTVTAVDDQNVGSTDFSGYDVIVAMRNTPDGTRGDAIRALIDGGMPVLVGTVAFGLTPGSGQDAIPTLMNLTTTYTVVSSADGVDKSEIVNNSHYITSGFSLGNLTFSAGANYSAFLDSAIYVGTLLATGEDGNATVDGMVDTIAIESGTEDLATPAVATGARVVVASWCYWGQDDLTTDGTSLLAAAINWLLGASGGGGVASRSGMGMTFGMSM